MTEEEDPKAIYDMINKRYKVSDEQAYRFLFEEVGRLRLDTYEYMIPRPW